MKKERLYMEYLTNMFGDISEDIKERLSSYLERPSYAGWEDIHGIIIMGGFKTVWQTILEVDPTFPRTGRHTNMQGKVLQDWDRIPDKKLLMNALKHAAEQNSGLIFN
jgi:hypothetical protein